MKAVADEADESEEISDVSVVVSKVGVPPGLPQPKMDRKGKWRVPKSWGAGERGRDMNPIATASTGREFCCCGR